MRQCLRRPFHVHGSAHTRHERERLAVLAETWNRRLVEECPRISKTCASVLHVPMPAGCCKGERSSVSPLQWHSLTHLRPELHPCVLSSAHTRGHQQYCIIPSPTHSSFMRRTHAPRFPPSCHSVQPDSSEGCGTRKRADARGWYRAPCGEARKDERERTPTRQWLARGPSMGAPNQPASRTLGASPARWAIKNASRAASHPNNSDARHSHWQHTNAPSPAHAPPVPPTRASRSTYSLAP